MPVHLVIDEKGPVNPAIAAVAILDPYQSIFDAVEELGQSQERLMFSDQDDGSCEGSDGLNTACHTPPVSPCHEARTSRKRRAEPSHKSSPKFGSRVKFETKLSKMVNVGRAAHSRVITSSADRSGICPGEKRAASPHVLARSYGSFCRRRLPERRTLIKVGPFIPCYIDNFGADAYGRKSTAKKLRASGPEEVPLAVRRCAGLRFTAARSATTVGPGCSTDRGLSCRARGRWCGPGRLLRH